MAYFSWLHISDLHCGMEEQEWLWPEVKNMFLDDLKDLYCKLGPWDFVLFTGDITHRGLEKEFDEVNNLLNELWETFDKLGFTPKLLAVPGNHDLTRPSPQTVSVQHLKEWNERHDVQAKFWDNDKSRYRQAVAKAFKNYTAWWKKQPLKGSDLSFGILPGDFSFSFEKNSAKLGILGLNTTFIQLTGDDYKGRLALHPRQFQEACGDKEIGSAWAKKHHACILLTHHSPEWLHPESQKHLQEDIAVPGRFAVHLCGHMHKVAYQSIAKGGNADQRVWQGHSLFSQKAIGKYSRLHGYTAGKIQMNKKTVGEVMFWPRKLRNQGGGQAIVPDYSLKLTDDYNQHTIPRNINLLKSYNNQGPKKILVVEEKKAAEKFKNWVLYATSEYELEIADSCDCAKISIKKYKFDLVIVKVFADVFTNRSARLLPNNIIMGVKMLEYIQKKYPFLPRIAISDDEILCCATGSEVIHKYGAYDVLLVNKLSPDDFIKITDAAIKGCESIEK